MSALEKIAYYQNRRDEIPNQLLAGELVKDRNAAGISEIVKNLDNKNKNIRSDCLKVLYEVGYLDPSLIEDHVDDFLKLLNSRDNRMVWGALIALAAIADHRPGEIWAQIDNVIRVTETGTIISKVWGIRTLARVAAHNEKYKIKIFPILLNQIRVCIARDVPTHAESSLPAVDLKNKGQLASLLESRRAEFTTSQLSRFKKVLKLLEKI
jgi:hypothetical protein